MRAVTGMTVTEIQINAAVETYLNGFIQKDVYVGIIASIHRIKHVTQNIKETIAMHYVNKPMSIN